MSETDLAKVLIVEDESIIRAALRRLLEKHGYHVEEAGSVAEARTYHRESFDIIVSDLRLPGEPGTVLIQESPATPVLLMTSYASLKSAVDAMKIGAADYIAKPFDHDEMLETIGRIVSQKHLNDRQQGLTQQQETNSTNDGTNPHTSTEAGTSMIGQCQHMQALFKKVSKVAPTDSTVLILGESGTGKELVAKSIHAQSPRCTAPLISVNCAAIPETLIESELFGHEKGSFTGAHAARKGLVEAADKGTLFLDEIGELPLEAQARLLRLLQEKEIRRIGSVTVKKVDIRLVAATHRNLKELAKTGKFREDLYYRLHVIDLKIPPLRDRENDILLLADFFLKHACNKHKIPNKQLSTLTLDLLSSYSWPGNVRELEHAIERGVILSDEEVIPPNVLALDFRVAYEDLNEGISSQESGDPANLLLTTPELIDPAEDITLEDYFQRFVLEHQDQMTETELAQKLGVSRKCLWERRQKFGIPRKKK